MPTARQVRKREPGRRSAFLTDRPFAPELPCDHRWPISLFQRPALLSEHWEPHRRATPKSGVSTCNDTPRVGRSASLGRFPPLRSSPCATLLYAAHAWALKAEAGLPPAARRAAPCEAPCQISGIRPREPTERRSLTTRRVCRHRGKSQSRVSACDDPWHGDRVAPLGDCSPIRRSPGATAACPAYAAALKEGVCGQCVRVLATDCGVHAQVESRLRGAPGNLTSASSGRPTAALRLLLGAADAGRSASSERSHESQVPEGIVVEP
jgi:hypothetical protein